MAWFDRGKKAYERRPTGDGNGNSYENNYGFEEFWVSPGEVADVIILDNDKKYPEDLPFKFYRHQFKLPGKNWEWETCSMDRDECCFCIDDKGKGKGKGCWTWQAVFTLTVFFRRLVKKDGKIITDLGNRVILAGPKPAGKLKGIMEKHKHLYGLALRIERSSRGDARVGETFKALKRLDPTELSYIEDPNPIDYENVIVPKPRKELMKKYGIQLPETIGGFESDDDDDTGDDDWGTEGIDSEEGDVFSDDDNDLDVPF